ncbi:MAG TPA: extracellular solute-binding protein [Candidatus Omnitrophota bacterium]|nr:extracellular solute-binding protein [Candidatus Omnitrophota bacterium]
MKKIMPTSLAAVLFLSFLFFQWGCSQASSSKNEISVWHWMTDRHETFLKLAQKYEQQTGIKVHFELYAPSDAYSQKIVAAAQAKVLPDIFGILDKKEIFASFIQSGFVADLTEDFKANGSAWEKSLFPKALSVNRFDLGNIYNLKAGIYGVPLDVTNIQMVYNRNLFKKAGIDHPPKNFEEFLSDLQAVQKIGVSGFVSGWGELWMVDCFASNYAFNIMGEEKVMATYRGDVPYTDADWIRVLNVFKRLKESGGLAEGVVTKANKYAEQDFALERAAFAFNGSWCVNVYQDMNPDLQYGTMLPPILNQNLPMKIWGGAGSSFVVNNMSNKKAMAIDFLKWLSAKDQQAFLAAETKNLPANQEALASIPQILSDFANTMDHTTHPTLWKYNEDALVTEAFDKGIQSILIGEKTPEQVAQEVQKVKTRQIEKERSRRKKN